MATSHARRTLSLMKPILVGLVALCGAMLLAACEKADNAELVILRCADQEETPLPPGVMVTVEGVSAIWNGAPLRFPLAVDGPVRLVTVRASAGDAYVYLSKPQYEVRPGASRAVILRFFRPYTVTIEAQGQEDTYVPDAAVYANDHPIGTTDAQGRYVWRIDRPDTDAGIARAGARFDITLEKDGATAAAEPLVLAEARFAYAAAARLNVAGIARADDALPEEDDAAPEEPASPDPRTIAAARGPTPSRQAAPERATPEPEPVELEPVEPERVQPEPAEPERARPERVQPKGAPPVTPVADVPAPQPVEAETTPASPRLQQADAALAAGRLEDAVRLYRQVPRSDRRAHKQALQRIGQISLETKNYEAAVEAFEAILRDDPSEYAAHNNLAAVYLTTEAYDEALDHLNQVLAKKHLIPREKRREAELDVRYVRASIHYVQFQNERDALTKKERGLLAMGVLRAFLDQTPPGDAAFAGKRREIEDKLQDIRQWVTQN